jgi:two-component system heavy metal sensor histidine kinase CusS
MALAGVILYHSLAAQISRRDDGALLTRLDQIRTLLMNEEAVTLVHEKPRLFANMLGNTESLLVLRFPGQPQLVVINPGRQPVPSLAPVPVGRALSLADVRHQSTPDGTPFIAAAAMAKTLDGPGELEIITGRLMTERTRTLAGYCDQIIGVIILATLVAALAAQWLIRRGLAALHRLSTETDAIDARRLAHRIRLHNAPPELQPLVAAFNNMLQRLETGFQQLSQVSADMAHDLRTPISNLLGQTEVAMAQPRSNADYLMLLGSNYEELVRISRMIDNMLFLAKSDDPRQAIQCRTLSLATECARLAEYFEGPAAERHIQVTCPAQGEVWADAGLFSRAVANLLANALRYAEPGSTVRILGEHAPQGTCVIVENSGEPIPAADLPRLFDRFWRADSSRQASSAGSGLGLSIVSSIMRLHQGRCVAESHAGVTRFSLFFPAQGAVPCDGLRSFTHTGR